MLQDIVDVDNESPFWQSRLNPIAVAGCTDKPPTGSGQRMVKAEPSLSGRKEAEEDVPPTIVTPDAEFCLDRARLIEDRCAAHHIDYMRRDVMPLRDAQKPVSKQAERTSSTALSRQVPSPASPNLFEITSSMWLSAVRFGSRFAPPMVVVALFAAVLGFGGIHCRRAHRRASRRSSPSSFLCSAQVSSSPALSTVNLRSR
ncbi:MAG: hypothetical protein AAGG57_17035 [Pseudomonadota bacterium]